MKIRLIFSLLLATVLCNLSLKAQESRSWSLVISGGSAFNFPSPVKVVQDGYDDYKTKINFKPENYVLPPYYDIRLETSKNDRAWGVRFTHLKLIMPDNDAVFNGLQISHGFNMFDLYRKYRFDKISFFFGGGVTLAHPEGRVRGQSFVHKGLFKKSGYVITLPNIEAGICKQLFLTDWLFIAPELRLTASYSKLELPDGHVRLIHFAGHATLGIGFQYSKS